MAPDSISDPIAYSNPTSGDPPKHSSSDAPVDPQTIRDREATSSAGEFGQAINSRLPQYHHYPPAPNPERSMYHAPPPQLPPLRMPGQMHQEFSALPPNSQIGYPPRGFHGPVNPVMSTRQLTPQSPQHAFPPGSPEYAQRNVAYAQAALVAAAAAASSADVPHSPQMQWYNSTPYFPVLQNTYYRPQQMTEWPYTGQGYALRQGHHHPQLGNYQSPHSPQSIEQSFENLGLSQGAASQNTNPTATRAKAIPRGPPRRPKQSGPALWVGNLPPKTTIHELKELFSRGRKAEIESVRLLSKTSCAFVNYRTHEACESARDEFHDAPLGASRLSCKIAENMTDKKATDRASRRKSNSPDHSRESSPDQAQTSDLSRSSTHESKPGPANPSPVSPNANPTLSLGAQDRYFILKSLTLQDVEASTVTGLWATQAHNEELLKQAYHSAANVFLIFSVNKSGEYFGYARMASPIPITSFALQDGASSDMPESTPPSAGSVGNSMRFGYGHDQNAIVTLETAQAPKGQIYEEFERGIIFWEAAPETQSVSSPNELPDGDTFAAAAGDQVEEGAKETLGHVEGGGKALTAAVEPPASVDMQNTPNSPDSADATYRSGNFFRIDWIVIRRVPFFKCRGLRNAWNSNKKVKVARDGTELETAVGRKLLDLFQRIPA